MIINRQNTYTVYKDSILHHLFKIPIDFGWICNSLNSTHILKRNPSTKCLFIETPCNNVLYASIVLNTRTPVWLRLKNQSMMCYGFKSANCTNPVKRVPNKNF